MSRRSLSAAARFANFAMNDMVSPRLWWTKKHPFEEERNERFSLDGWQFPTRANWCRMYAADQLRVLALPQPSSTAVERGSIIAHPAQRLRRPFDRTTEQS